MYIAFSGHIVLHVWYAIKINMFVYFLLKLILYD